MSTTEFVNPVPVLITLLLGCNGSASGSHEASVADFSFNECKSERTMGKLMSGRETSDYTGLECVAWDFRDKSNPKID